MSPRHHSERPLAGRRIVVTRAREQASDLSGRLIALGAEVVALPVLEIVPVHSPESDEALRNLDTYDWVLFTSANAATHFIARLAALDVSLAALAGARVGAVGPATATRLEAAGIQVALVPEDAVAESMLASLVEAGVAGARILLPRAKVARDTLPTGLRAAGATVDVVPVYETRRPATSAEVVQRIRSEPVDCVTFTSASSVRNTLDALGGTLPEGALVACIGPITADAARESGLRVDILAKEYTIPGLVDALVTHFGAGREVTRQ